MAKSPPPLLYADSSQNPDQLYFGRVPVPDPFISFRAGRRKVCVVSALEFGRVKRTSDFDVVLPLEFWHDRARRRWPGRRIGPAEVIVLLAHRYRLRAFTVPDDFPAGVAFKLARHGIRLSPAGGLVFPERELKTAAEAAAIREGNRCAARGLAAAEGVLRQARVRGRWLWRQGRKLTSEHLKFAIEVACLSAGGVSLDTIVAGGDQACDPHECGSGPLRAHDLIIVDIFPRITATGYYGDMTRTFLRGRASDAQRRLVATVRAGQRIALAAYRAGAAGRKVHQGVADYFEAQGYETRRTARGSVGFFHGTGHGLGLAVHEPPRVAGTVDYQIKQGAVITVEPGLYYPGLGGCRIEDVVQVTAGRPRLLSRYHYEWELR
ncbi:MAG: peptidase M24 [Verrucomicrobia bacterium RIFCSPLOWO2_12_FULL_64_8]|nr:MAG: peptidase M24 [Verrucomicrobia bacterium RIFCSPLOWO2_12_FULL_64_8]